MACCLTDVSPILALSSHACVGSKARSAVYTGVYYKYPGNVVRAKISSKHIAQSVFKHSQIYFPLALTLDTSVTCLKTHTKASHITLVAAHDLQSVQETDQDEASLKHKADEIRDSLRGTSIFLIGMMGSGKSTVGEILAKALGYYFFDSDKVVEQAAGGASTAEIFAQNGEEAFRDTESKVIAELSHMGRLVVATGGGAVIRNQNWGNMRHGVTVMLDVPLEELAHRLSTACTSSRPLLAHESESESEGEANDEDDSGSSDSGEPKTDVYSQRLAKLSKLWEERKALYRNADFTVSILDIAAEMGVDDLREITSTRIALQVLEQLGAMVKERQEKDRFASYT
eukprot:jgi/Mesen1/10880/ME000093S10396